MVAGHKDERFVRVLFGKVDGDLYRIGQRQRIGHSRASVIGVAGPVDLAAFAHHKEAGVVVQNLDALFDVVGQRPFAVLPIHFVVHSVRVCQMLVDQDDLFIRGGDGLGVGLRIGDLVACLFRQIIEAGLVLVGAGDLLEAAAGKIFKTGLYKLFADLVVIVAAGLMGVERGGSRMVEVDRADDADLPAFLAMEFFRDRLIGRGAGDIHVDHAGIGLVAGGDGGRRGGRIRREAARVIGDCGTGNVKIHEVQRPGAIEHRACAVIVAVAGKRLHIIAVCQRAEVIRRGLELRIAHAVADEEEHILGSLGGGLLLCGRLCFRRSRFLFGFCYSRLRLCGLRRRLLCRSRSGGTCRHAQRQRGTQNSTDDLFCVHWSLLSVSRGLEWTCLQG